jgi:hypothetical protein
MDHSPSASGSGSKAPRFTEMSRVQAATVVVVDADGSVNTNRSRMYPLAGARFDVGSLRPGDYYVFAVDRPTPPGLTEVIMRVSAQPECFFPTFQPTQCPLSKA